MYKAPVKRPYLSSPTMSIDLDISATIMNYVLISSHNVDVALMLARVTGGFLIVYFSYVDRKVRAELQRREC